MKSLLFLFALSIFTNFASAEEENSFMATNCNGYASIGGASATLNCMNGNCSGWLNSQYVSANGNCDQSGSFQASGYLNSVYISGSCNGNFISIFSSPENVSLTGNCTNGSFSGSMYINGGFASGSCQPNGMSTIFISGGSASVSGTCN